VILAKSKFRTKNPTPLAKKKAKIETFWGQRANMLNNLIKK